VYIHAWFGGFIGHSVAYIVLADFIFPLLLELCAVKVSKIGWQTLQAVSSFHEKITVSDHYAGISLAEYVALRGRRRRRFLG